jgi:hypothetical protein
MNTENLYAILMPSSAMGAVCSFISEAKFILDPESEIKDKVRRSTFEVRFYEKEEAEKILSYFKEWIPTLTAPTEVTQFFKDRALEMQMVPYWDAWDQMVRNLNDNSMNDIVALYPGEY